jgi:hypothetical protein
MKMPYIIQKQRAQLEETITALINNIIKDVPEDQYDGVLNYILTEILHRVVLMSGVRYNKIQQVIGILECAKLEIYRRVAVDYEDRKAHENGDVGIYADAE